MRMQLERRAENVLVQIIRKTGENVLVNIEEGIQEEGSESRDSSFSYDSMGFYEGTKSQMMI